jgi:hypothetical protein
MTALCALSAAALPQYSEQLLSAANNTWLDFLLAPPIGGAAPGLGATFLVVPDASSAVASGATASLSARCASRIGGASISRRRGSMATRR